MALAAVVEPEEQLAPTEMEALVDLRDLYFPAVLALVQVPMEEARRPEPRVVVPGTKEVVPLAEEVEEALELAIPGHADSVQEAALEAL